MLNNNFDDNACYFLEISLDPNLMDVMFTQEDNLFFQHPDFTKPLTISEKKDLIKEMRRAIKEDVTTCQRESLELYFFHGKSEVEISQILNRHQTTISQHIRYGIKKLRKVLSSKYPTLFHARR